MSRRGRQSTHHRRAKLVDRCDAVQGKVPQLSGHARPSPDHDVGPGFDEGVEFKRGTARLVFRDADRSLLKEEFEEQGFDRALLVEEIRVDSGGRRQGRGSGLIRAFLEWSDEQGVVVVFQAYPIEAVRNDKDWNLFDREQRRLVRFYKRFGFSEAAGGWMYRKPGTKGAKR